MLEPVARPLRFGHRRRGVRGPLALCLVLAAALTPIIAPRASSTARAPMAPDAADLTPFAQSAPPPIGPVASLVRWPAISPAISPAMADLLVLDRGAFQPIDAASLLFSRGDGDLDRLIATAAAANDLPPDFFLRLLRQESGLNPYAVSPVGAQGIAQFMPGTAAERGLRNPFDPVEAIPKSAELLREHRARFGNLGLAAAAYNAGPQRVRGWLDGRSGMPAETRDYVIRITGRPLEEWALQSGRSLPGTALAFLAPRSLGSAWAGRADPLLRPASLLGTEPVLRDGPVPSTARSARTRSQRPSARSPQPRSEQALCAVLNGEGRTCLVQAVY
ncbi:lytic transglycosylase domain-containing protein [Methylobacterium sp. 092160098-2]|jgi:soluble lytic murein transglycosylase-like protein|uniref:lytic transglycosylase domain-containing protein n=1 Tax=unclassified Methylobacterium TaxID=2615210 RepID=UPI0006B05B7A|nr:MULTISPECIES: lytic transglycosylase domain-containing protein [unclassified Methylobacterium]KOX56159.1 hypothetical protein ADL19_10715 [Streptomyces purpurogeneiscleroticus]MBP33869.1 lytic transglycosylase domain-containing protein [Methylobacterium sp.]MDE4910766.1 lytic transglycosylase domain-containing protein [Methylobacterium sp. 092160098-2]